VFGGSAGFIISPTVFPTRSGLVVGNRILKDQNLARALVRAIQKGVWWLKTHPLEAKELLARVYTEVYQQDMSAVAEPYYALGLRLWSVTGAFSDYDLRLLAEYLRRPSQPPLLDPAYNNDYLIWYLRQLFVNDYLK
jgi:ABC-type nitrate/sulfonate/bicarbonate transport system substrate-binding protein